MSRDCSDDVCLCVPCSVSLTYAKQPQVFRSVVRLLQLFQDGYVSEIDLARQCVSLLRGTPNLVKHFALFLSTDVQLALYDLL